MSILCVAEKPSIAKSITQILSSGNGFTSGEGRDKYCRNFQFQYRLAPGNSFNVPNLAPGFVDVVITSVRGHLTSIDFNERVKRWSSCSPSSLFTEAIEKDVSTDAKKIAQNLQELARHATVLMIWTDCDREGEHIGSEIVSVCQRSNRRIPVKRAKFSAIIASQIHHAMQHPIELDWNAVAAVECRMELDLRLGAAFTRLQTLALQRRFQDLASKVISYGPCQFPTLGFVVEQYRKVIEFVPEPFWYIFVMKKRNNMEVDFRWARNHLFNENDVTTIFERCKARPEATVTKVIRKPTRKFKPQPLTTVELQKAGGRLLRMAPKRVLEIAEKLYQRGILSYPRTETDQYDPAFDFRRHIDMQVSHPQWGTFAAQLQSDTSFEKPNNGQKNDKAHPPIHPTKGATDLSGEEQRVYEFVTRRFLASCSKHAVGKQTTVELDIADEKFAANGVVVVERNYLEVYPYDSWGGPALPDFDEGEKFMPTKLEKKEGETTRPKLLTEADLVGLMDRNGIGTDATIAEHIAKIIEREYIMIEPEGKINYLVPSTLGMAIVEGFNRIQSDSEKSLCKPLLRRETEEKMTHICQGTATKEETIRDSLQEYRAVYIKVEEEMGKLISSMNRYLCGEFELEDIDGHESRGPAPEARTGPGHGHGPGPPSPPAAGFAERAWRDPGPSSNRRREATPDIVVLDDDESFSVLPFEPGPSRSTARSRSNIEQTSSSHATHRQSDAIQCRCGLEPQKRTVQKEGLNKGKEFWTCQNCGFFEWVDRETEGLGYQGNGSSSRGPGRDSRDVNGAEGQEVRRCECDLVAVRLVSSKEGPNHRRAFWKCSKISKSAQCRYFVWEDEDGATNADPPRPRATGAGGSGRAASGTSCFRCGQEGHWSSECTNEGGASEGRGGRGRGRGGGASTKRRGSVTRDAPASRRQRRQ